MQVLPFNLFDILLAGVLVLGIVLGRKHGMSGELLGLIKWLSILFLCALAYLPIGGWLAHSGSVSLATACLLAYLAAMVLIWAAFAWAQHGLQGKLSGSDTFGRCEYYLGMASGMVRASCVLLVGLALLNAPSFSPAEIKAMEAYQDTNFGTRLFPSLHGLQVAVFDNSLTGPWIKQDLGFLLIRPEQAYSTLLPSSPVAARTPRTSH